MRPCGWSTRSMLRRYNTTDARDLEQGVARVAGYLKPDEREQRGTKTKRRRDNLVELNGIEPSTS